MHNGRGIRYKFYCINPSLNSDDDNRVSYVENYWKLHDKVVEDVEKLITKYKGWHFYYQILPLSKLPEKGRGNANDVSVGKVLWADIDYKQQVGEKMFEGCKEGEDYKLECYYEEGGKVIKVDRPSLKQVLDKLNEAGIVPTIVVDSGAGYHLYWVLMEEYDAKQISKVEGKLIDFLRKMGINADTQAKDLARTLRIPYTINPRVNRQTSIIMWNDVEYTIEEIEEKITPQITDFVDKKEGQEGVSKQDEIRVESAENINEAPKELKELEDWKLIMIKELLKEVYKPGNRQKLLTFLAGWAGKAGIHPLSMIKLTKLLHDETGDEEPLRERAAATIYTYKKLKIDVDQYADEIKQILGDNYIYGLGKTVNDKETKGKGGLLEVFEETLGEERALDVMRQLEEILNMASPYRDATIEVLDYNKQIYAVANLRKLIVARAKRAEDKLVYMERITIGAPTSIEVFVNPLGGVTKFKVKWEAPTRPSPIIIGPAYFQDVIDRLSIEGLVVNKRLVSDVLSALFNAYIRKGKAVMRTELDSEGFYYVDGRIIHVGENITKPTSEELREALIMLNDLVENWFKHVKDRFSLILKWGIISPFIYMYKTKYNRWVPYLYLYGASHTGKTSQAEIILYIWGKTSTNMKTGSSVDTVARLGSILSSTTYPTVINEPGPLVMNNELIDVLKSSVEMKIVRGKFVKGTYVEIPSLSPIIFTSNRILVSDDALMRRLMVLTYSFGERIPPEKAREYEENIKPNLPKLQVVGRYVASLVMNNPSVLEEDWKKTAVKILETLYTQAGLEIPNWVHEETSMENVDVYEELRNSIREFLIEKINQEYFKAAGRVNVNETNGIEIRARLEVPLRDRIDAVLTGGLIPWLILKEDEETDKVIITSGIMNELKGIGNLGGLKSFGELLGWEYKRSIKIGNKVIQGVITSLDEFREFLM